MKLHNTTFLLIAIHAPHTDSDLKTFFALLIRNIPSPPKDIIPYLLGDFNFTESPASDSQPPQYDQPHPSAINALLDFKLHLCKHQNSPMIDIHTAIHGADRRITYHCKDTERRYDRAYAPEKCLTIHPTITKLNYFERRDLAARTDQGTLPSDHDAIQILTRASDETKPKKSFSYRPPRTPNELRKYESEIDLSLSATTLADPEHRMDEVTKATESLARKIKRANRLAENKTVWTLKQKGVRLQKVKASENIGYKLKALKEQITRNDSQLSKAEILRDKDRARIRDSARYRTLDRGGKDTFKPLKKQHLSIATTKMSETTVAPDGKETSKTFSSQEEIANHQREKWSALFDLKLDFSDTQDSIANTMANIKRDKSVQLTSSMIKSLDIKDIISTESIITAIEKLKKDTAPDQNGLTSDFFFDHREALAPVLNEMFKENIQSRVMTPKMRQAVVTLIYKSKDLDPEKWKNYRPIAVTDIAYRILGTCIQLKLAPLLQHLTGESQPGFIPDRRIDDDIMAVTELAHYCNNRGRSGIFILLDAAKAYDRVLSYKRPLTPSVFPKTSVTL